MTGNIGQVCVYFDLKPPVPPSQGTATVIYHSARLLFHYDCSLGSGTLFVPPRSQTAPVDSVVLAALVQLLVFISWL